VDKLSIGTRVFGGRRCWGGSEPLHRALYIIGSRSTGEIAPLNHIEPRCRFFSRLRIFCRVEDKTPAIHALCLLVPRTRAGVGIFPAVSASAHLLEFCASERVRASSVLWITAGAQNLIGGQSSGASAERAGRACAPDPRAPWLLGRHDAMHARLPCEVGLVHDLMRGELRQFIGRDVGVQRGIFCIVGQESIPYCAVFVHERHLLVFFAVFLTGNKNNGCDKDFYVISPPLIFLFCQETLWITGG